MSIVLCPACLGRKNGIGLGMLASKCPTCGGVGHITSDIQDNADNNIVADNEIKAEIAQEPHVRRRKRKIHDKVIADNKEVTADNEIEVTDKHVVSITEYQMPIAPDRMTPVERAVKLPRSTDQIVSDSAASAVGNNQLMGV